MNAVEHTDDSTREDAVAGTTSVEPEGDGGSHEVAPAAERLHEDAVVEEAEPGEDTLAEVGAPDVEAEGEPEADPPTEGPEPEPKADSEATTPPWEQFDSRLTELSTRLEEAHRLLAREKDFVDRLHTENERLKSGELRSAQLPLIRDLLRVYDDSLRMEADGSDQASDLGLLRGALLEALRRSGVEDFAPDAGDAVDPSTHNVVGVDATDSSDVDKSVSELVRTGFRWESGGLVRPAEVRAYRYREQVAVTEDRSDGDDHEVEGNDGSE